MKIRLNYAVLAVALTVVETLLSDRPLFGMPQPQARDANNSKLIAENRRLPESTPRELRHLSRR